MGCKGVNSLYDCIQGSQFSAAVCKPKCGDGKVVSINPGQSDYCDDGNSTDSKNCKNDCTGPIDGYYCSTGNRTSPSICT